MKTPSDLGIKKRTYIAPKGGWKPQTHYLVETANSSTNVIHRVLFYSGFLCDDKHGNPFPGGYNCILSHKYDGNDTGIANTYYMKALEELNIALDDDLSINEGSVFMDNKEVGEKAKILNELATEISGCLDYKPWHINWITRSKDGAVQAWEPDNTCIYSGSALNAACRALNHSTYNG